MRALANRRGLLAALLALTLLSACGRLHVVSLTREIDPCDYHTAAVQRLDTIANALQGELHDPISSVLRWEALAVEAFELLPTEERASSDAIIVTFGEYLLAAEAARAGDAALTKRYVTNFITALSSLPSKETCGT